MVDATPLLGAEPPGPIRKVRGDALSRADDAWRLRVAGATWAEVATVVGFANAENAIRAVRQVYGSLPEVPREELRTLWRERLERLWRQTLMDATEHRPGAVMAGVRVAQAAARLDGLDAPSEVLLYAPSQQELEAWVAQMMQAQTPELEEADIFAD